MRPLLLCLILCCYSCSDSRQEPLGPNEAIRVVMWESGSVKERYRIKLVEDKDIKQGPYQQWHESGAEAVVGQYVNDLKHGYWHYYLDSGVKEKKVLFDMGNPKRTILSPPRDTLPSHPSHHHPHYLHPH